MYLEKQLISLEEDVHLTSDSDGKKFSNRNAFPYDDILSANSAYHRCKKFLNKDVNIYNYTSYYNLFQNCAKQNNNSD